MTRAKVLLFSLLTALTVAACSEEPWQTRDISTLMPSLAFNLTDEAGKTVTADDYRGKAVLLFFGFTSCPDVCPITLSTLSSLLSQLTEAERERIRVLFVSVDPQRDTPGKLQEYTSYFGPQFVGLTGTQEQLRALNKRYLVTYDYGQPDESGFYSVSHSGAVFGFAPSGEVRVLMRESSAPEAMLADIRRLINEG